MGNSSHEEMVEVPGTGSQLFGLVLLLDPPDPPLTHEVGGGEITADDFNQDDACGGGLHGGTDSRLQSEYCFLVTALKELPN